VHTVVLSLSDHLYVHAQPSHDTLRGRPSSPLVVRSNSYAWILRLNNGFVVDGIAFFDGSAFDDV
jgi:hypothetical protein